MKYGIVASLTTDLHFEIYVT